ncbi:unnamed protein product [Tenebrio molitor]|jgi:heme/copper-type cytochrome/quinol oxidase subunit 2|nr:unnamed protein product [Tenebrio molitor]
MVKQSIATPGRLNQVRFTPTRSRLLYGQCSEICGANHRFIPIVAERISPSFCKVVIESHERVPRSLKEGVTVLTANEQLESENKSKLVDRRLLPI